MQNRYDLIILGAGPAGVSAGIYAGRAKLKTLIIDAAESGGQIRITSEVVNYPGVASISGPELSATMLKQAQSFGAELLQAKVQQVDFSGPWKKVVTAEGTFEAVAVVVATGAKPRTIGFEGESQFRGHGVGYCATCDGEFFTGMDVFVLGGGFAAAEEAIFLTRYARQVYVIVRESDFTCSKTICDKVLATPGITVQFDTEIKSLTGDTVPRKAVFVNNQTGEEWQYQPEQAGATFGVFVFAGYQPQSDLFKGQLALQDNGYIPTDEHMQTNVEGVYAAGDIRPKELRQLVTAVADGAIASTNAEKFIAEQKQKHGMEVSARQEKKESKVAAASFIDKDLAAQLVPFMEKFENPLTLVSIGKPEDELSAEMETFVSDLAALSPKVSLAVYKEGENPALEQTLGGGLLPVIALLGADGADSGIHYHAVPSGHEFDSFLLAMYNVAGPGQALEQEAKKRIQALAPLKVQVGMSLSCTMCPDVVQAMQQIALYNKNVRLDIIDVSKFPEFRTRHQIMSVPAVVFNDGAPLFGKKTMNELLDACAAVPA